MTIESHFDRRITDLRTELEIRRADQTRTITDEEWNVFARNALEKIQSSFGYFSIYVKWDVRSSLRGGFSSWSTGALAEELLMKQPGFRLVAEVEPGVFFRFPAKNKAGYDYPQLQLGSKNPVVLTYDTVERSPQMICDGEQVDSTCFVQVHNRSSNRKIDVTEFVKKALLEEGRKLSKLYPEFHQNAVLLTAKLRLKQRIDALEAQLLLLERAKKALRRVHLPAAQLLEIMDHLETLVGSQGMAPGLLLKGPSGTGKTFLAEAISEAGMGRFLKAGVNTIKKSSIGKSAEAVRELFREARASKPCILFIDEIDGLCAQRGSPQSDAIKEEITTALLAEWSGKEHGVWVIAATNRPDILDDAILGRFGIEMEITHPDAHNRELIVQQELVEAGYPGSLPSDVAKLTQGMSGRDLSMLARRYAAKWKSGESFDSVVRQFRSSANPNVSKNATWDRLILDDEKKTELKTTCAVLKDPEGWAARGIKIPKGVLLKGPTGTGKTQIARTMANESGLGFVKASPTQMKGTHLGNGAANIHNIFEKARAAAPCILFFDEIDISTPRRDSGRNDPLADEMIGQILQEMDGIVEERRTVYVMAATNHPDHIDPAILDRLTTHIEIPLPTTEFQVAMLRQFLADAKIQGFSADNIQMLADISEGYSGRSLENWVSKAAMRAVGRALKNGSPDSYRVTMEDFMSTIQAVDKQESEPEIRTPLPLWN